MLDFLEKRLLLHVPEGDRDRSMMIRAFNTACLSVLACLMVGGIGTIFFFEEKSSVSATILVVCLLLLLSLRTAHRGNIRPAAMMLVCGLWGAVTVHIWLSGTLNTVIIGMHIAVICMAGVLLGLRCAEIIALLTIASAFGLSLLQILGYAWPSYYPMKPWAALLVLLFTIVFIVPLIDGTVRSFSEASAKAREEIETRRRAEETARKSEAKYRFLVEHSSDLIWTLDLNLRTTFVTPSVEKVLGFTPQERMLQQVEDQLTPESLALARQKLFEELNVEREQGIQEGQSVILDLDYYHKNGSIVRLQAAVSFIRDEEGIPIGLHGISRDVTALKRAQEALSEKAELLSEAQRVAKIGNWSHDLRKNEVAWSDELYRIFGIEKPEFEGTYESFLSRIHPEDRQVVIDANDRVRKEGTPFDFEYRIVLPDGQVKTIREVGYANTDGAGNVISLFGTAQDITDSKKAEVDLRKNRERLQIIFEASPAGIILVDPEGLITFANNKMGDLFSRSCEDLIGTPYVDLVHESQRSTGHGMMTSLLEGEIDHVGLERLYQAAGGRAFIGHLAGRRILKEDGALEGLVGIITDITDRKEAEEALRESEERFRLAMEATSDGVWDWDLKTDHVFRSPGFFSMLGYKSDDLRESFGEWQKLVHPVDFEPVRRALNEYLNGMRETYEVEFRMINKSGSLVWILSRGKVVARDHDEKPLRMIGTHTDITERKEAEKQIRKNQARLQSLYDIGQYREAGTQDLLDFALNEAIRLTESKVGYIYHYHEEKYVFELNTWSKEVMKQCEVAEPQTLYELEKTGIWGEAVRQRKPIIVNDFQAPNPLKKGYPEGHVELHNFMTIPVVSGDRIVAVVGVGNKDSDYEEDDVRQLSVLMDSVWRIAEAKRNESAQRRLVTAVEQAAEGIVITDRLGNMEYVNPAYETITGNSKEEVIGRKHPLFGNSNEDSAASRGIIETLSRGEHWSGHLVGKRKDGRTYEEDVTVTPVLDPQGNVVNFVMVKRDVTKEADLQRQLLQAQKMEAIGTLAGGVAHDFNNILQVALGYTELLLGDESLPKQCLSDLRKVHESAKRGADLVQRLLTFSRKTEINPRPLNLNRRITELRKMLERTVPKMIDIRLVLDEGLSTINADPTQIDQVIMNLTVNARDSMPNGGKLTIETANVLLDEEYARKHLDAKQGANVLLTVTDTGVGMDKETLERIFEPFYTTKGVGEGTGLGLAMVHGIIKHHGGHVRCYSEPGYGTTFRIYFPALPAEEEQEETAVGVKPKGGSETILLVDDEEFLRDLGSRILTKAGYKVITASNGREALEAYKIRRDEIDLVLLDLIMPEMGGRQCLEGLLSFDPSVKVVIASGYSADAMSREALVSSAKGFVDKPYDRGRLLGVVRDALEAD